MRFEGTSEDIEKIPNERVVSKVTGGMEATHIHTRMRMAEQR